MKLTNKYIIPCFTDGAVEGMLDMPTDADEQALADIGAELGIGDEPEKDLEPAPVVEPTNIDEPNDEPELPPISPLEQQMLDEEANLINPDVVLDDEPTDNTDDGKGFDLDATLNKIQSMKTSQVRKYALEEKAKAEHAVREAEARMAEYEEKARVAQEERDARYQEYEEKEQKFITEQTTTPIIPATETDEYKGYVSKFTSEIESVTEFMEPTKKNHFKTNAIEMAHKFRQAFTLEGHEHESAMEELRDEVEGVYGDDANEIMKSIKSVARIDKQASEFRANYDTNAQEQSKEIFTKKYVENFTSTRERLKEYTNVSDEEATANPFAVRTFTHKFISNSPQADTYRKLQEKDANYVSALVNGYPPFNASDYKGVPVDQAKQRYIQDKKTFEAEAPKKVPEMLLEAQMIARIFPDLMKRYNALLEKGGASSPPTPTARTRPQPSAPTNFSSVDDMIAADERALAELGGGF